MMSSYHLRNLPGSLLEINNEDHRGPKLTYPVVIKHPSKTELRRFFKAEYGAPDKPLRQDKPVISMTSALQLASIGEAYWWSVFKAGYVSQKSKRFRLALYLNALRGQEARVMNLQQINRTTVPTGYKPTVRPYLGDTYKLRHLPTMMQSEEGSTYREVFNHRLRMLNTSPNKLTFQEIAVRLGIDLTDAYWEEIPIVFRDHGGVTLGPELRSLTR